jgi:lipopolysaccharide export system protein LptA
MRLGVSVKRLRWGLLASATLLVVLVAVFLGYGHYRMRDIEKTIRDRVKQRINEGLTYSDSVGGKINYTLHADSGGEVTGRGTDKVYVLHGVKLDLYGRTDGSVDHVYGKEFEYNSTAGTIEALGDVDMDIEAPTSVGGHNTKPARDAESGAPEVIHVKTSGLIYVKHLGVAATKERVEFSYGAMHGSSQGAEFDNGRDVLRLLAQVEASGEEHGQPLHLTASKADYDRTSNMTTFENAVVNSGERTARADHAMTYLRHDSSVERLEGTGSVVLSQGTRQVNASRLDATFTTASVVEWMKLTGGVTLLDSNAQRPIHGGSREAEVKFDAKGSPAKIVATGGANVAEIDHRAAGPAQGLRRTLSGEQITMNFVLGAAAKGAKPKSILRELHVASGAKALGDSWSVPGAAVGISTGTKGAPVLKTSQVAADDLVGEFVEGLRGEAELKTLHGKGHTQLQQNTSAGAEQVSTGDALEAMLTTGGTATGSRIESALQTGHVTIHSKPALKADAKPGTKVDVTTATAERANYDGATGKLRLTGNAQVNDETTEMSATSIVVDQPTGNAEAEGNVVATVLGNGGQSGDAAGAQVTHVMSASAKLQHAAKLAEFHGTDAQPAKLWQGASQVQAANLFLDGDKHTMAARPEASGALIHAVFAGANAAPNPAAAPKPVAVAASKPVEKGAERASKRPGSPAEKPPEEKSAGRSVARVSAQKMDYAGLEREATFQGAVRIDGISGDATSQRAVLFLTPVAKGGASMAAAHLGVASGTVDHIVLSGDVQLEQPRRHATGETLLYTAATGRYVLTGTPTHPPRAVDAQQGTVTGTSLTFGDSGSTIIVAGEPAMPKSKGTRVRTETEVRPEGKK